MKPAPLGNGGNGSFPKEAKALPFACGLALRPRPPLRPRAIHSAPSEERRSRRRRSPRPAGEHPSSPLTQRIGAGRDGGAGRPRRARDRRDLRAERRWQRPRDRVGPRREEAARQRALPADRRHRVLRRRHDRPLPVHSRPAREGARRSGAPPDEGERDPPREHRVGVARSGAVALARLRSRLSLTSGRPRVAPRARAPRAPLQEGRRRSRRSRTTMTANAARSGVKDSDVAFARDRLVPASRRTPSAQRRSFRSGTTRPRRTPGTSSSPERRWRARGTCMRSIASPPRRSSTRASSLPRSSSRAREHARRRPHEGDGASRKSVRERLARTVQTGRLSSRSPEARSTRGATPRPSPTRDQTIKNAADLPVLLQFIPPAAQALHAVATHDWAAAKDDIQKGLAVADGPGVASWLGSIALDTGDEQLARKAALEAVSFSAVYPPARMLAARVALVGARLDPAKRSRRRPRRRPDPPPTSPVVRGAVSPTERLEVDLASRARARGSSRRTH